MILTIEFVTTMIINVIAQTLHDRTIEEVAWQTSSLDKEFHIDVGITPLSIAIHEDTNQIYDDIIYNAMNTKANIKSTAGLGSNNVNSDSSSAGIIDTLTSRSGGVGNISTPVELTYDDVKRMNLGLVDTINDAISKLTEKSFVRAVETPMSSLSDEEISTIAKDSKAFYVDKLGITSSPESALSEESSNENVTNVAGYIKSGNIDGAISALSDLLPTMDSSFGGALADDRITNENSQEQIYGLINNAIDVFKSQSCTHSDCTSVAKDPNATIEY